MTHRTMSQSQPTVENNYVNQLQLLSMASIKSTVGWGNNDELRLLNKLSERIRGHSFDLGVNIAEATKSYGTIVGNLKSVGSALWHLKHGRYGQALRVLGRGRSSRGILAQKLNNRDLTGRWLETQYAFLPLISQSYEAAKALESVTGARKLAFSAGSGTLRSRYKQPNSLAYSAITQVAFKKSIRCELSEELPLGRSLGLTNPLEIAWEVVPYSFVVDWFLPVGSYISAWGVIPGLNGRFMTTDVGTIKRGPVAQGTGTLPNWKVYAATNRRENFVRIARTSSSGISVPRPTFNKVPKALSARRIFSAVSLIHQRLR